ncbi:MAG: hypothetical protein ACERKD_21475 [Prolixibacteraceae bacterium]
MLYETNKYFNKFCSGNILQTNVECATELTDNMGTKIGFAPVSCRAYTLRE